MARLALILLASTLYAAGPIVQDRILITSDGWRCERGVRIDPKREAAVASWNAPGTRLPAILNVRLDMAEQHKDAVRQALRMWQSVMDLWITELPYGGPQPERTLDIHVTSGAWPCWGGNVAACAYYPPPLVSEPTAGDVWLRPPDPRADFVTVVAHEVGHALGLDHRRDADANSIMGPVIWQAFTAIPWPDRDDVCAVYSCPPYARGGVTGPRGR